MTFDWRDRFDRGWLRLLACLSFVVALVWTCYRILQVNATTAALAMVLLVLGVAAQWGLREAIFTSIACVLGFNYYFLPPVGAFTIADPQNWIALLTFLVTAITAGQLSTRAKRRAEEASARRAEVERLYALSRALLMAESNEVMRSSLVAAAGVFGFEDIAFFDLATGKVEGSADGMRLGVADLERAASENEVRGGADFAIVPVRFGTRTIGSLGFAGRATTEAERDSIANLIAINYARAEALEKAASSEAARRSERLRTSLLDGIAHDLKTPLTAIKTCVTTLISIPPRTEEKRGELLTIISEETDRLQRTITEAIQLARIDSGSLEVRRVPVNLQELIEDVIRPYGDDRRYIVSVESSEVDADPVLISQALKQVVENARKYSPVHEPIEIRAIHGPGQVTISVLDRGPGIAPSEHELIFHKFYRGARGRGRVEGTGMGLSIARGIIEAHGGTIHAENRPSGGAAIVLTIPTKA